MLSDNVLDNGLQYITTNGDAVYICSQDPTTYTEATSTYALGNETAMTMGSPENGDTNGRKIVIPAITTGTVTSSGTATHYAVVKTTATTELLATQTVTSQAVATGTPFTLNALDITIPDPA